MKPFFSVIIPTLNEERYISNILKNLSTQDFKDFEVIVVDAESNDKTLEVVGKFNKSYPLTTVNSKKKNLSYQRNLGAREAKGEYLFFIDADNQIPNDFLSISKKCINKNNCNAIIPELVPEHKNIFNKFVYPFSTSLVKLSLVTPRPFSTGGNLIIYTNLFKKTNGFSEKVFVGEDHDMVRQLKELKAQIKFMSETNVILSMRRFEQEGFSVYLKYAYAFIYQIVFRKVNSKIYNYRMGGHLFKK